MSAARWFRAIWWAGGLALVLGLGRGPILGLLPRARELPRLDGATGRPWIVGEFALEPAVHIEPGQLPSQIQSASSGARGDEWQGRAETAWFRVTRRSWIHVAVAGYPQHAGCRLWVEFQYADGAITRLDYPRPDPHERWNDWEIRKPSGAVGVRIVAEDHASDTFGWLAFSHPFRALPGAVTAAYHALQIFTTIALALTLLWGPGLLWRPHRAAPAVQTACILGLGALILASVGIAVWCLSGIIPPLAPSLAGVAGLWAGIGYTARQRGFDLQLGSAEHAVLGIAALVVVAAAAKSSYSGGPEGELFRGTISRNLSVGDRIDSRYPYYVVQAAVHHHAPASPATEAFFYPWTFFSRGPLAGLATLPVVAATGGQPPPDMPDQRWAPYDEYGFAAYRITMMTLASGIVLALFAALLPFTGERAAIIAAGLLALSPFGVHEMMFTWPKWAATTWVVISFSLAHARRPYAAGAALALGYFFHPMTLLWAPWLASWAAGRWTNRAGPAGGARAYRVIGFAAGGLRFGAALLVLVLPWMAVGAVMPHLPDTPFAGQGGFLRYWLEADWHRATWDTWWHTRWRNFANTFVPLHVYFDGFDHPKFRSAYEESGRLVKFAFVWWNSLPFALGLGLWGLSVVAFGRSLRVLPAASWLLLVGPALLLTAYWGMDPLGLMRECGHPLFVAIIAVTCLVAARGCGWLQAALAHPAVPWLQLPETLLMLWLTTFANRHPSAVELPQLDTFYVVMNVLALVLAARVLSRSRAVGTLLPTNSREAPAA